MPVSRETAHDLQLLANNPDLVARRADKLVSQRRLIDFMEIFWPTLHPGQKMKRGWALEAICDHLEGVHHGHIQQLLITVPPGFSKSMATNVFFPAWEWGPRQRPSLQYLCSAYGDHLTQRDNERARMLMGSREYQLLWGDVFGFDKNTDGKIKFQNDKRGYKEATSTGGAATGGRADRLICDDPHNVVDGESEPKRAKAVLWFTESWATRTNNDLAAHITIMQRIHEMDVAAACIELGFVHLCIPMMFEWDHPHRWFGCGHIANDAARAKVEAIEAANAALTRAEAYAEFLKDPELDKIAQARNEGDDYLTSTAPQYGPGDPRREEGELAFPELFNERRVARTQRQMALNDPQYAIAGQMQQRPSPRGGGDVKDEYFNEVDATAVPEGGDTVAGYDLAGTKGKTSPFTCKYKLRRGPDGLLYVLGRAKERVDAGDLDQWILDRAEEDGPGVLQSLPQDPGQAGKYQKTDLAKKMSKRGLWYEFSPESGDKIMRFKPFLAEMAAGNTRWVRGEYLKDAKANLKKHPAGKYKDDADALSRAHMALTMLRKPGGRRLVPNYVRINKRGPYDDQN